MWCYSESATLTVPETTPANTDSPLDGSVDLPEQAGARASHVAAHLVLLHDRVAHHGTLDFAQKRHGVSLSLSPVPYREGLVF